MKVGVIGLGTMGMGAALNLLGKGHDVTGCETREAGRTEFMAAGGAAVGSPAEFPADLEAVVVFVVNAAQTETVLKTLTDGDIRKRAMDRTLRQVEALPEAQSQVLLPTDKEPDEG